MLTDFCSQSPSDYRGTSVFVFEGYFGINFINYVFFFYINHCNALNSPQSDIWKKDNSPASSQPPEDPPRTAMVGVPSNVMNCSRVRRYFIIYHPNIKFTRNSFSSVGDETCTQMKAIGLMCTHLVHFVQRTHNNRNTNTAILIIANRVPATIWWFISLRECSHIAGTGNAFSEVY
jgi:hypothetical protein